MPTLKATTKNVIYTRRPSALKKGSIELLNPLKMETMWCDVVCTGPDSILQTGDHILLSARPVSYEFAHNGILMYNTSDASTLAFKSADQKLQATCGTILYSWIDPTEKVSESGIIIVEEDKNKEKTPQWALVHAAGPDSGVKAGDHVLLAFKTDAYSIEIDGIELHNGGKEEVIAYYTPE